VPESLQFRLLQTTRELEEFSPQWDELWRIDGNATPFQSPAWLLPWWHCFTQELRALVISRSGELVAFLPFYLCHNAPGASQLLLLGVGTTDYLDGLFAPVCTTQDVASGLRFLGATEGWDMLCASQLRPHSLLAKALESVSGAAQFEGESCSQAPAARLQEMPLKVRRNVRTYRNRAMRLGRLELAQADSTNWSAAFDDLVRLHSARWQCRGEPGVFADERVVQWHRAALPILEDRGMLRLLSLRVNGETVAVLYALVDPPWRRQRTAYLYLSAYALEFAELSPGTLLLAMAIDRAAEEGVKTVDMLRGDELYKQFWHPERTGTLGFSLKKSTDNEAQAASDSTPEAARPAA